MDPSKLKSKNTFSSSILKLKLKKKVEANGIISSITDGHMESLENLAEQYKKALSTSEIQKEWYQQQTQNQIRDIGMISELTEEQPPVEEMESLFVDSSKTSITSLMQDDQENFYQTSVFACVSVTEPEELVDRDLTNLLQFIKKLSAPPMENLKERMIEFGEYTRHKTLIWDMDETLIHSQPLKQDWASNPHSDFVITLNDGAKFSVAIRPYYNKCLDFLAQYYEMAIFTAAEQEYADKIIDYIDPNKTYFAKRLYRQHCTQVDQLYIKDLRIIADRELEDLIIVDNSIISFAFQLNNGVPICSFYTQNKFQDQELLYLITYLEEIYSRKDCREANKQTFKLEELMNNQK